ncbi:hypothetical protein C4X99_16125 [Leptospira interrogans serovar Geyaweera]|nr:hypothetical protein C5473_06380 [Leptospira interrogans serovar Weerasinghe]KAA1291659.1 hypothetical protein C4X99_16125 [Leptospira interrogans serovar Geyaweera]
MVVLQIWDKLLKNTEYSVLGNWICNKNLRHYIQKYENNITTSLFQKLEYTTSLKTTKNFRTLQIDS